MWLSSNIPSESTPKTDGNIVGAARVSRVRVPSPGQQGNCTFLVEECPLPYLQAQGFHSNLVGVSCAFLIEALTNESLLILWENYLAS